MKYGFVKVAAVSPKLKVADVRFNLEQIKSEITLQASSGTEILVFPELGLCGYTSGDLFLQPLLIDGAKSALIELAAFTKGIKTLIFVGLPFSFGGKLYNVAAAISDGRILGLVPKTHIPNYAEFYEKRYFNAPLPCLTEVCIDGQTVPFGTDILFADELSGVFVAAEICEDLWSPDPPSTRHAAHGANVIVNLSASDETIGKADYRRTLVSSQSGRNVAAYIYADAGADESTTDMVFAGHNLIAENGTILSESLPFTSASAAAEIDVSFLNAERTKLTGYSFAGEESYRKVFVNFVGEGDLRFRKVERTPFVPTESVELGRRAELILTMQAYALKKRLEHTLAKTAVIGISGGLDSSLALLVTARAFELAGKDKKEILAVTMPGFGTSGRTNQNARKLIECLGASFQSIDITKSVLTHFEDIGQDKNVYDVTYENAQARTRTLILMDLANKTGGLVVGTGDLSEAALGWCTYNGDHMSMYGVNSSVPKTLVKHLVRYEAARLKGETQKVLEDVLDTEISPELLPPSGDGKILQKTEDLLGKYELHDFYLYHAVRLGETPKKVYYLAKYAFRGAYSDAAILNALKTFYKRFFSQQFKRSCMPDSVKIGSVTLSPRADFRMPSDASAALWLKEIEELV